MHGQPCAAVEKRIKNVFNKLFDFFGLPHKWRTESLGASHIERISKLEAVRISQIQSQHKRKIFRIVAGKFYDIFPIHRRTGTTQFLNFKRKKLDVLPAGSFNRLESFQLNMETERSLWRFSFPSYKDGRVHVYIHVRCPGTLGTRSALLPFRSITAPSSTMFMTWIGLLFNAEHCKWFLKPSSKKVHHKTSQDKPSMFALTKLGLFIVRCFWYLGATVTVFALIHANRLKRSKYGLQVRSDGRQKR